MSQLSIITITYNQPEMLRRTLQSLITHRSKDLGHELIVIDSSPSLNASVLNDFRALHSFKHVVVSPCGIYAAMNDGLRNSSAPFVWFLHGGDSLTDIDALARVIQHLDSNPLIDFISGISKHVENSQKFFFQFPHQTLRRNLLFHCGLCQQAIIYRRRLFEKIGFFSLKYSIAGDYEHYWRAELKGCQFERVSENFVAYDTDGVSSVHTNLAFREIKQIHASIASELSFPMRRAIRLFWLFGKLRSSLFTHLRPNKGCKLVQAFYFWWKQKLTPPTLPQELGVDRQSF